MDFGAKTTARATQPIISGDIGMFRLRTGGAPEYPDITAIQRSRGPVKETMNIKRRK